MTTNPLESIDPAPQNENSNNKNNFPVRKVVAGVSIAIYPLIIASTFAYHGAEIEAYKDNTPNKYL